MKDYEVLEHTADVGLSARARTLEELFARATRGLAEIMGIWRPDEGGDVAVAVAAHDLGALLVDWLSEILYLHDARNAEIAALHVDAVEQGRATGTVALNPLSAEPVEGIQVKAITYHQLKVEERADGWFAQVFFDV